MNGGGGLLVNNNLHTWVAHFCLSPQISYDMRRSLLKQTYYNKKTIPQLANNQRALIFALKVLFKKIRLFSLCNVGPAILAVFLKVEPLTSSDLKTISFIRSFWQKKSKKL